MHYFVHVYDFLQKHMCLKLNPMDAETPVCGFSHFPCPHWLTPFLLLLEDGPEVFGEERTATLEGEQNAHAI